MFYKLDIDWSSGWDKERDNISAADHVNSIVEKEIAESSLFKDYFHYCIDIIQTLCTLPLKKKKCKDIRSNIKIFLNEWKKIEKQICSPFYNLYILKCVVNITRIIKKDYMNPDKKEYAIETFKEFLFLTIDSIAEYCRPKDIHYEKMLLSLLILADNIEGIFYKFLNKITKKKKQDYEKLPLTSILQMYGAIDINIQSNYIYTKDTIVCLLDIEGKQTELFSIPENYLENLNSLTSIAQGTYIYDIFKNR